MAENRTTNVDRGCSSILCAPSLCYEGGFESFAKYDSFPIVALNQAKNDPYSKEISKAKATIANGMESHLCSMLCSCASKVPIPAYGDSMWANPKTLKALLSESGRRRLEFVDCGQTLWAAIERYFEPVSNDLKKEFFEQTNDYDTIVPPLDEIVWELYLLMLAARGHSEVPINPDKTLLKIDKLISKPFYRAESRIRLASVRGIFALFHRSAEIPSFRCIPGRYVSLMERLDEIIDDAYLLDASRIRRFFGLKSNIRAVTRDLRKLTAFIVKARPWAKGVFAAASQSALLPKSTAEVADKLFQSFPELAPGGSAPVLVEPHDFNGRLGKVTIVSSRNRPFLGEENWLVTTSFENVH